jgi:TRAP-type C4-dicarboxylate transport system substrate-binding protein
MLKRRMEMKKIVSISAVVALFISLTLVGAAFAQQTFNWKMGCTYPPPQFNWESKYIANDLFAKRVADATQGRVKIKVFYSNQLVPQSQALDALKKGVADLISATSYWAGTIPETDFVWLPFWSKGEEHAIHALRDTKIGKILDDGYRQHGSHLLYYWPVSIEGIMSKKPIRAFEDVKGMKFRVSSAIWPSWYKDMGVAPINVAVAEQYEALMRGTLDATIYPIYTIETYKFYEVCKYLTLPGFVDPMPCYTLVSLKAWNALPPDLQQTVQKVALEIERESIIGSQKLTDSVLDFSAKRGVEVILLNRTEFEKFRQSAMPLWEKFAAKSPACAEMVKIIRADLEQWTATRPEAKKWEERWLAK